MNLTRHPESIGSAPRDLPYGAVLHDALAELGRLPADACERRIATQPLLAARLKIPHDTLDAEEKEIAAALLAS